MVRRLRHVEAHDAEAHLVEARQHNDFSRPATPFIVVTYRHQTSRSSSLCPRSNEQPGEVQVKIDGMNRAHPHLEDTTASQPQSLLSQHNLTDSRAVSPSAGAYKDASSPTSRLLASSNLLPALDMPSRTQAHLADTSSSALIHDAAEGSRLRHSYAFIEVSANLNFPNLTDVHYAHFDHPPRRAAHADLPDAQQSSEGSSTYQQHMHAAAPFSGVPASISVPPNINFHPEMAFHPELNSNPWHHCALPHSQSIDLSDSILRLLQYERYITNVLSQVVTTRIIANTPLYLATLNADGTYIMILSPLPPLTPEFCQEFRYFTLRLEQVMQDMMGLRLIHPYWSRKRDGLMRDMGAARSWLFGKMQERIGREAEELRRRSESLENALVRLRRPPGFENQQQEEREQEMLRRRRKDVSSGMTGGHPRVPPGFESQPEAVCECERVRRRSEDSIVTTSSMDSATVGAVEGGITHIMEEDEAEERATMERWDLEIAEREAREAANGKARTPLEREAEERSSADKVLGVYLNASAQPYTPSPQPSSELSSVEVKSTDSGAIYQGPWRTPEGNSTAQTSVLECAGTPTPAPRGRTPRELEEERRKNELASFGGKMAWRGQQSGDENTPEKGGSHPFRAEKSPPKGEEERLEAFEARGAKNGLRMAREEKN